MDVAVVVLNWNAAEDTITCLKPMLKWQSVRPSLIVVDNASQGDDVAQIYAEIPPVHLIANKENEGFSGGSNRGIDHALAQGEAPILLLNNDAAISEAAVMRLAQTLAENPKIGLVVPRLVDEKGALVATGGKNPAFHLQTRITRLATNEPVQFVATVSGTAVLIRPALLRQAGLLDERFFFSTEMADLSLRARQFGYVCAVEQRAQASHAIERAGERRSTLYVYYIVRNRFLILRNHYPWRLDLRAFWLLYTVALWLKLRLGGSRQTARAVGLGLGDALSGRFGGQNERVMAFCGTDPA